MIQSNPLLIQSLQRKDLNSTQPLTKTRGDIKLTNANLSVIIDFAISANNLAINETRNNQDMANQGQRDKESQYNQFLIPPKEFVPFAMSITGVASTSAEILLSTLVDEAMICNPHLPRSRIVSLFRQHISVAMQINTANTTMIMMNYCNPNIPCNNNIILTNTGRSVRI